MLVAATRLAALLQAAASATLAAAQERIAAAQADLEQRVGEAVTIRAENLARMQTAATLPVEPPGDRIPPQEQRAPPPLRRLSRLPPNALKCNM